MSPSAILLPLMGFDEACRLVVDHLKREVPLAFWAVSRYEDDQQIYVCVEDDAYGKATGGSEPWSDSFCQYMVTGAAPQIAPDAMAVPEYASTSAARDMAIGAYVGVPIRGADGTLYGTICGLDPRVASQTLTERAPLLHLFATLLGQILQAENLRAEAVDREAKLHWSAFHDHLTGLPNRAMFFDHVEHALELGARDGRSAAVPPTTSTSSRPSTTPSDTPPATRCSRARAAHRLQRRLSAPATPSRGWSGERVRGAAGKAISRPGTGRRPAS